MDNIKKRINIVENIITNYFYDNDIHKSSCLAQSYILYKYICNLIPQNAINPILVKGYIINHEAKIYYGHFWVEYGDNIYDIATETYLLNYELKCHDKIRSTMRILVKNIPNNILHKYKNLDHPLFQIIRDTSFKMCMENKFLEDVKEKAPIDIYEKIKKIYDKLIH